MRVASHQANSFIKVLENKKIPTVNDPNGCDNVVRNCRLSFITRERDSAITRDPMIPAVRRIVFREIGGRD